MTEQVVIPIDLCVYVIGSCAMQARSESRISCLFDLIAEQLGDWVKYLFPSS